MENKFTNLFSYAGLRRGVITTVIFVLSDKFSVLFTLCVCGREMRVLTLGSYRLIRLNYGPLPLLDRSRFLPNLFQFIISRNTGRCSL